MGFSHTVMVGEKGQTTGTSSVGPQKQTYIAVSLGGVWGGRCNQVLLAPRTGKGKIKEHVLHPSERGASTPIMPMK